MRRVAIAVATLVALVASAGCGGSGGSSSSNGKVTIVMWHGQSSPANKQLAGLAAQFMKAHPDITIQMSSGGTTTDGMLQKVTAALAADTYPDIAYIYGSWGSNIARSSKVADIKDIVSQPKYKWDDFWPNERARLTVDGKVIGFPAVVDNLVVMYNKKIFAKLGIPEPSANWSWDDFRAIAKQCTDPSSGSYGFSYPTDSSEDTVWRFWAMLWQGGGTILSEDGKHATFNSDAGVRALTTLQQMAVTDHSVYLDPTDSKMEQLFLGGKTCMHISGPWELLDYTTAHLDYGVQVLPGTDGDHQTISAPDDWVVFNHSEARVRAAVEFLNWLDSPAQSMTLALDSFSLPVRASAAQDPRYQKYLQSYPGIGTIVDNLQNAKQAEPNLTQYPQMSKFVGDAIVSVLLGRSDPKSALDDAAQKADAVLAVPS
jgi:multiple sugar transport system substrate-binding protein